MKWKIEDFLDQFIPNGSSVLDLGSGLTSPILRIRNKIKYTGLDIKFSSEKLNVIQGNVLDAEKIFTEKFDVVVALDLIEHLEKIDGHRLLEIMYNLSNKKIIIFTPNGFMPEEGTEENPYLKHLSGWNMIDFESNGFKVYGIGGLKDLHFLDPINKIPILNKFYGILLAFTNKITWENPEVAYNLIAIKEVEVLK